MKKLLSIILLMLCLAANVCQSQYYHPDKMFGQILSGQYAEGLVFYWRGIEAVEAVDEARGNNGTIIGATWVGQGLDFNGTSDYVIIGDKSVLKNNNLTYAIWIKTTGTGERQIYSKDQSPNWNHLALINGIIRFTITTSGTTDLNGSIATNDGNWHFVCGTYDGVNMIVYVDGIEDTRVGKTGSVSYGTEEATIGARAGGGSRWFLGMISDLSIYSRALSASEIAALALKPNLPMQQEPIWLFKAPPAVVTGQVIIISKQETESIIISTLLTLCQYISLLV